MPWVPVHQTVLSMYLHLSQLRKAFKHVIKSYLCWWDSSKNFKLNTCQNALLSWEGLLDASCRVHLDFPLGACGYDGRSQVCRSNLLTTHSLSIPGAAKPLFISLGVFWPFIPSALALVKYSPVTGPALLWPGEGLQLATTLLPVVTPEVFLTLG